MRVWEIHKSFGLQNLAIVERPAPRPGFGEILIRVKAASLNFRDLVMVQGLYDPRQPLPLIPLSDGVGEVTEVGVGVTRFVPGDRVAGTFFQDWISGELDRASANSTLGGPRDGMLTEQVVLPERGAVKIPEHLSDIEAATLPCAGLTAWSALYVYGNVRAGDTVLLLGTGGVSIFALQFANLLGAQVIITSKSDEKLRKAKQFGAAHVINYKTTPDWERQVFELTGGKGVDHVVEVGGGETLEKSLRSTRFGGQVSIIGVLSGLTTTISLHNIYRKRIKVQGIFVGHRDGFESMNCAISQHLLRPIIDRVFPFENAPEAFSYFKEARHLGKVCIEFKGEQP